LKKRHDHDNIISNVKENFEVVLLGRRLSLMVYYDDEDVKTERVPKKVYMIINGEKIYIDPEIVKKYDLDKKKISWFTGRKLYAEEN
jgi:hypothetical protein